MKRIILLVGVAVAGLHGNGWERSVTGTISTQQGNTELRSYAAAFSSEFIGDLRLGPVELKDSEVKFALSHTRGQLDGALYQNDGSASFLLDIMARQSFSPFFLSFFTYDSTTALERRIQVGVGGKYSFPSGFSVSLASMWELQDYKGKEAAIQFRWSLRPKFKRKFANGMSVNYVIFMQPLIQKPSDVLVDTRFILSIPTVSEKLSLTLTRTDKYNSLPPEGVQKRDTDVNVGITWSF